MSATSPIGAIVVAADAAPPGRKTPGCRVTSTRRTQPDRTVVPPGAGRSARIRIPAGLHARLMELEARRRGGRRSVAEDGPTDLPTNRWRVFVRLRDATGVYERSIVASGPIEAE